jgi:SnoaL-like protein
MTLADDRADIIELFSRYADIADLKEFTDLPRLVFTDPLTVDFSSVVDSPPMTVTLSEYLDVISASFAGFAATHHAITGHVVDIDGDTAKIHAHVRADHWLPAELVDGGSDHWVVVGFYANEAVRTADGWRLNGVKLTAAHQVNPHLSAIAMEAAQAV